jgi:hypothetical protein
MQFTLVLAICAACVAVGASPVETNGQRMARGLPPLYPVNLKRGSPVARGMWFPFVTEGA